MISLKGRPPEGLAAEIVGLVDGALGVTLVLLLVSGIYVLLLRAQVGTLLESVEEKAVIAPDPNEERIIIPNEVDGRVFFDSADDRIRPEFYAILEEVAGRIASELNSRRFDRAQVEGHTDDRPLVVGARFADNWELGAARATAVVRYLIVAGVREDRLAATSYGSTRPAVTGVSDAARQRNRRIEVLLLRDQMGRSSHE